MPNESASVGIFSNALINIMKLSKIFAFINIFLYLLVKFVVHESFFFYRRKFFALRLV